MELWARNCPIIIPKYWLTHKFRDVFLASNLRRGTDGFTSLRTKACRWCFSLKIRQIRPCSNLRTWVLKASTLPQDYLLYLHIYFRLLVHFYLHFDGRFERWWVQNCFHLMTHYFCQPCWIQWRMCCISQGLFVNTQWFWNLERRWQCAHLVAMHSALTARWYIMDLNHAYSGLVSTVFINLWNLIISADISFMFLCTSVFSCTQSCHNFCYNFHDVQSWRQWGRWVVIMAVFELLSLQILVPTQFALVCHSVNMECGVN